MAPTGFLDDDVEFSLRVGEAPRALSVITSIPAAATSAGTIAALTTALAGFQPVSGLRLGQPPVFRIADSRPVLRVLGLSEARPGRTSEIRAVRPIPCKAPTARRLTTFQSSRASVPPMASGRPFRGTAMRLLLSALLGFALSGCAVNQSLTVVHTAQYDAQGHLIGYTVEETLYLPKVTRPLDRAQADVMLFETGSTIDRKRAQWPPPRMGTSLRTADKR